MQFTPLAELERRVQNLQAVMQRDSLDGALLTEKMDLFYFGGSMQQGFLFIPVDQNPLFMVKRNFKRAKEETNWEKVMPLNGLNQLSEYLHDYACKDIQRLGLELDILPVNLYQQLERIFPHVQFVDLSKSIREVRMIKSEFEIKCFREASKVAANVNRQIPGLIKVGKPEIILGTEIESLYRKEGHQGILRMRAFNTEMFFGHVYSGENGAASTFLDSCTGGEGVTPACPQGAGWKALAPHEPIGVDYGSMHGGYVLDYTRVFSIGALPPELERAYDAALQVQESVVLRAVPGAVCGDLYELALEIAAANGLGDFFEGYKDEQVKFIGHGVGLDVDEYPLLSQGSKHILEPGMVFALEPKFIFPGKGMIGLENVWLVTESGLEKISLIPDDLVTVPLSGA
ncbi:MAG: Xaa-Pro peptidase family protein [Bacillota bacterium]|nr:Xaa-Pro peptidase family protein [Bacillota bacterium]